MAVRTMFFSECEHIGDKDNYESDLRKCGLKVVDYKIYYEDEECSITVQYEGSFEEFIQKFKDTDSFDFWE
jgi:hypothetical protein